MSLCAYIAPSSDGVVGYTKSMGTKSLGLGLGLGTDEPSDGRDALLCFWCLNVLWHVFIPVSVCGPFKTGCYLLYCNQATPT